MSWDYVTLDMLGDVSRGKSKHRPRNDASLFGGQYPFIQTADVKSADFYINDYTETYNEKGLAQSKLWKSGTLCITIAANIADTAILGIDACFPDSIMGFVPYDGVSDVRFVKYSFDLLQKNMKQISQGTAQDNLSWEKLSTFKFPAPHIDIQRKIADYLSAYDDLIENNQKQIKLLEEAAQRLYKEWFVDLRFPGHEQTKIVDGVPENWSVQLLSQVFSYVRGKSYSSSDIVDDRQAGISLINLNSIKPFGGYKRNAEKRYLGKVNDNQFVNAGDVLMGVTDMTQERRLVGHVALVPNLRKQATFSMDLIKLEPFTVPKYYLYASLRYGGYSNRIAQLANGVNVLHLKPESIMNLKMPIPQISILKKFDEVFASYQKKIEILENQMSLASEARDRLLPKLMNGEIEL